MSIFTSCCVEIIQHPVDLATSVYRQKYTADVSCFAGFSIEGFHSFGPESEHFRLSAVKDLLHIVLVRQQLCWFLYCNVFYYSSKIFCHDRCLSCLSHGLNLQCFPFFTQKMNISNSMLSVCVTVIAHCKPVAFDATFDLPFIIYMSPAVIWNSVSGLWGSAF